MINYNEFEKNVYNWLLSKDHQGSPLYFSMRQKAAKGAEKDYFIGTRKSGYFATTFWWIPISFPGSSSDLIDLIFKVNGNRYKVFMQFCQTKDPFDRQNELALAFIREFKEQLTYYGLDLAYATPEDRKMEYYDIVLADWTAGEGNFEELEVKLDRIVAAVDESLADFTARFPDFDGLRINEDRFENIYQRKLKVRLEKGEAIQTEDDEVEDVDDESSLNIFEAASLTPEHHLNTIFYGPPGTGKTYHTMDRALRIADPAYYQENSYDRDLIRRRYSELTFKSFEKETDAQIAFCTFHQSMAYEDFIEGLKPLVTDKGIDYAVQDGIFKQIAHAARKNYLSSLKENLHKEDFDMALDRLKEELEKDPAMQFSMKKKGYEFTITGFTNTSIRYKKKSGAETHTLSLATLADGYYGRKPIRQTGVGIYYPGILEKLNSYAKTASAKNELKNYVLVIDEINRGNISQIFGELITSLETTKRLGNTKEELEIFLPYSKISFSVPPNLYIIGTMNTADRSVEALDTALRRRFVFEEMMPDPQKIIEQFRDVFLQTCITYNGYAWDSPEWKKVTAKLLDFVQEEHYAEFVKQTDQIESDNPSFEDYLKVWHAVGMGLKTSVILHTINERIEVLIGRDQLIGHSYFMNVFTWQDLKDTFYKNIIPLLQEYFYGDYGKIGLILGDGFIRVAFDESKSKVNFAAFTYDDTASLQRVVYRLIPPQEVDMVKAVERLVNQKI